MKADFRKYTLHFKRPSGTSRGILRHKNTWLLVLTENGKTGIGECGLLQGLSIDDVPEYESRLQWTCDNIHLGKDTLWASLTDFPSIQFGVEQAFLSLRSEHPFKLFPSDFLKGKQGLDINGLIWMGEESFMHEQIELKLQEGFNCIKMKIGAIDFEAELALLESIRNRYGAKEIELRVDANGAFQIEDALSKLQRLATFQLHSIEQPIPQGNWSFLQQLSRETPLPIALDEELIGIHNVTRKRELLQMVKPHYIILKPSLVGGFKGSMEWIRIAEELSIGWWVTSALESNVGLNAIAQWTATLGNKMPQGLGTGGLFTNNFECPLFVEKGKLYYNKEGHWPQNLIQSICI